MKQTARILAALERGPISPVDFIGPTVDGECPILRVAARVQDLRNAGHEITTERAPSGIALYKLAPTIGGDREPTAREPHTGASPTVPVSAVPSSLFECEDPIVGLSHYRADRAA